MRARAATATVGGCIVVEIMDGGMGVELMRRGAAKGTGLWSAVALLDAPETVVRTHLDYIRAGARVITTNSYATVPSYLMKAGLEARYVELTALAGELARRAADASGESVRVAGSLPPLSESYRPDLVPDDAEARPIYRALAEALRPSADLFLCETMSSVRESRNAAVEARAVARASGIEVYVSWTLNEEPGTGLRSGETITAAYRALEDLAIDGFLFNCTSPEAIIAGIAEMRGLTRKPIGGYPNRFSVPDGWTLDNAVGVEPRNDMGAEAFAEFGLRCRDLGASLIGGCCGVGPEDIAALDRALNT